MTELDYQTALLLQHQFEQEHKSKQRNNSNDEDFIVAIKLQEQFEQEAAVERPKDNLVYAYKKKTEHSLNISKSLVDPSWEVIDPTPDIHILFIAFNEKFFWNKLLAVTVSWSKRMTTCAGICSYQGRGGLCKITLSEPLLKLRPRKDLVETLLHEMIHAYLFLTNNDRDRDGHGPKFHEHMYRINAATGTNITVYHDFHDEVRLYQQHVWRCDGPCQKSKPYFGTVRRAMNRAPGPNDFWWAEHSRNCGGSFIKVSEPEKQKKILKKEENKDKKKSANTSDIRKFITNTTPPNATVSSSKPTTSSVKSNNIHTISNINASNSNISTVIPSKVNNIKGFTNLNGTVTLPPKTVTKTKKNATENDTKLEKPKEIQVFSGTGHTLTSKTIKNEDYSAVRSHWVNKFNSPTTKRPNKENNANTSPKIPKLDKQDTTKVSCPVCNKNVLYTDLNQHLDICLLETEGCDKKQNTVNDSIDLTSLDSNDKQECPVCEKDIDTTYYNKHVEKCLMSFYDDLEGQFSVESDQEHTECLACNKKILKSELDVHLEDCLNLSNVFDTLNEPVESEENVEEMTQYNCPICMKLIEEREMNSHINKCLKSADSAGFIDSFSSDDF